MFEIYCPSSRRCGFGNNGQNSYVSMKTLRSVVVFSTFFLFFARAFLAWSSGAPAGANPNSFLPETRAAMPGPSPDAAELSHSPQKENAGQIRGEKEKLYFDIYWMGIYVGNATLDEVVDGGRATITSEVRSAPVISVLYKVEDHASSTVVDGKPVRFRIKQREGRYRSDKETVFDAATGKVTYFDYRKGIRAEHEVKKKPVWDVISGFYHLRTLLLEVGKTLSLDIFDSNKMLKTEIHVLRKEKVAFPNRGSVEAFVVKPVLRTEGLFKHKGDILIWLTQDDGRIPVRVETKVSIGKVVAQLKRVEVSR